MVERFFGLKLSEHGNFVLGKAGLGMDESLRDRQRLTHDPLLNFKIFWQEVVVPQKVLLDFETGDVLVRKFWRQAQMKIVPVGKADRPLVNMGLRGNRLAYFPGVGFGSLRRAQKHREIAHHEFGLFF